MVWWCGVISEVHKVISVILLLCVTFSKSGNCLTCHHHTSSSDNSLVCDIFGNGGACYTEVMSNLRGCLTEEQSDICEQSESTYVCCHSDRCNGRSQHQEVHSRKLLNVVSSDSGGGSLDDKTVAIITTCVCVFLVTFIIALIITVTICCFFYHHGNHQTHADDVEVGRDNYCSAIIPQGETISSLLIASRSPANSSPSPSLSLLVQRAIVKSTNVETLLMNGKFYKLSTGRWRREKVMVKTYGPKHERMWFTDTQIHQVPHMHHPHILTFIAADYHLHQQDQLTHYLITEYHERGSLNRYLSQVTLDVGGVLVLAQSAASGLAHLHLDIKGLKPSIVHRNISSRSFFVKNDGTCCLGDFSLAIKDDAHFHAELKGKSLGHAPYLSPELLDGSIPCEAMTIEILKKTDVYSLGLVMWEIARRCSIQGLVEDAEVPFSSLIPFDHTSLEEARKVVCCSKMRPPLSEHWNHNEVMQSCVQTFTDCWHDNPTLRPSAMSVKNSLDKLLPMATTLLLTDKDSSPCDKEEERL